jgi:hypothetical protein
MAERVGAACAVLRARSDRVRMQQHRSEVDAASTP